MTAWVAKPTAETAFLEDDELHRRPGEDPDAALRELGHPGIDHELLRTAVEPARLEVVGVLEEVVAERVARGSGQDLIGSRVGEVLDERVHDEALQPLAHSVAIEEGLEGLAIEHGAVGGRAVDPGEERGAGGEIRARRMPLGSISRRNIGAYPRARGNFRAHAGRRRDAEGARIGEHGLADPGIGPEGDEVAVGREDAMDAVLHRVAERVVDVGGELAAADTLLLQDRDVAAGIDKRLGGREPGDTSARDDDAHARPARLLVEDDAEIELHAIDRRRGAHRGGEPANGSPRSVIDTSIGRARRAEIYAIGEAMPADREDGGDRGPSESWTTPRHVHASSPSGAMI